jgi:hypothetical protein
LSHRSFTEGSEDETENRTTETVCREDHQRHPQQDPQEVSGRRKIRIVLDGLRGEDSIAALLLAIFSNWALQSAQHNADVSDIP